MANEKKPGSGTSPSIYSDRGTIGSSDELDEYGVWVKSEPQDLGSVGPDQDVPADSFPDLDIAAEPLAEPSAAGGGFSDEDFDLGGDPDAEKLTLADLDDEGAAFGLTLTEDDDAGGALPEEDLALPEEDLALPAEDTEDSPADGGDIGFTEIGEDFGADIPDVTLDDVPASEMPSEAPAESAADPAEEGFVEVPVSDFVDDTPELEPEGVPAEGLPAEPEPARTGNNDLSNKLLMKIADELASIRGELSTLKKEFAKIRSAAPEEGEKGGFFDEEDDEKIALTGDELDNILNTADFTEEEGEDAVGGGGDDLDLDLSVEEPADETSVDETSIDEEPAAEEPILDEPAIEEPAAEPEPALAGEDIDISVDLDDDLDELGGEASVEDMIMPEVLEDKDAEELKKLREEGAEPLAPPPDPEDANYLETDPMAPPPEEEEVIPEIVDEDPVFEESLDLSDAVIDEPDFSAEITENPVEEPELDNISFDVEDETVDLGSEIEAAASHIEVEDVSIPEESIELPTDEVPEGFDEVPDGFVVEADETQEDLSLAVEDSAAEDEIAVPDLGDASLDDLDLSEAADSVESAEAADLTEAVDLTEATDLAEAVDLTESTDLAEAVDLTESTDLAEAADAAEAADSTESAEIPSGIRQELKTVLSYMDQLLESLPEDKIEEFARSEYFDTYKKLFKELGLV